MNEQKPQRGRAEHTAAPATVRRPSTKSMHEGVAVWCDCCSCEMEPYWAEVAAEMGIEFSDYEE